jgi:hypothetical protein
MTFTRLPVLILTLVLCAGTSRGHAAACRGASSIRMAARCRRHRSVDGPLGTKQVIAASDGRFDLPTAADATYRVIAKATGLISDPVIVRLPDDAGKELTITLHVAPIAEAVVVSAAQVPRPLSETPAASTVIARDEVEARQLETVSDALRTLPGMTVSAAVDAAR